MEELEMEIKIEKDVPIPTRGWWKVAFKSMSVGDSFEVEARDAKRAGVLAHQYLGRGNYLSRKMGGGKHRIWRKA